MFALVAPLGAMAHGVPDSDAAFLGNINGVNVGPLMYLGAKHMVTGYDHLLFLAGVIFFCRRLRDVVLYVSLFSVGHSVTLLSGVLSGWQVDAHLVDAAIGLSIVYKALENIGAFQRMRVNVDTRAAVLGFGLVHGMGLSTTLQEITLSPHGLVGNLVSFNAGVELGQLAALGMLWVGFQLWRRRRGQERGAYVVNAALMTAGFVLMGSNLLGYWYQ